MSGFLRDAALSTQIVAYAYFGLMVVAFALAILAPVAGRLIGRKTRLVDPFEAIFGVGIIVGIPVAFAALAALFVTPILIAIPLPLGGWLLIGAFAIYGFWGSEASGGEMGGCSKMIGIGWAAFGLSWAITAIILADPPTTNIGSALRPLLVAAPLGITLGLTNSRRRAKLAVGLTLLFALLLAVAFLPIERGFASEILPTSDWLRFPLAGAIVFGIWPLIAIPFQIFLSKRAVKWRGIFGAATGLALIGGLFGLVWAFTRLLF
jgi:hypothetical protein